MRHVLLLILAMLFLVGCTTTSTSFTTPYSTSTQSEAVAGDVDLGKAAKARLTLGLSYLENGEYQLAKSNLDKALAHTPNDEEVLRGMAWYYQQVSEDKLAEEYYQRALKINNKNPSLLNQYGAFLCAQKKYAKSLEMFTASAQIRTNEDISGTYENAATCNYLAGNLEQAEQNYRRALNHNPEQVGSLLGMAEIEFGKNRYNRTKSYLARFERVSRHTPRSLWLGAQNAAKMGDLDAVASYGLKLEQIFPDSQETENYLDAKDSWLR